MSPSQGEQRPGLRERKKARTRAAIQEHALRLFLEQGYAATTIEQIAEAAEVSQSTFFRYFPTKEETVLYDRLDPVAIDSFVRQPAELSPTAAMRAAVHEVFEGLSATESELERARQRLIFEVPELRTALFDQFTDGIRILADGLTRRLGRAPEAAAVRAWSGAIVGVVVAAFAAALDEGSADGLIGHLDEALGYLEQGLPL
ncbi:acyl-CoA-like ligand-binding transcription factor [Amycolatopsis aidingensis]|uniref:acyl-CoA-like ligand-binding transcription factor n=1 Tax=Amycolatopsis aidingensis TaxID=2842453 RepID=UPI001C0BB443|nr:TetR family transcriptional regulator [Amycolatopsis aidingensis]